jgi:cytoplasmic iron level regulating protein YaaA (DUF328/UPF0246 family)
MKTENEVIIERIEDIKAVENGFKRSMRWNKYCEYNGTHYSELDFNALTAPALVSVFEHVIRRYTTQM